MNTLQIVNEILKKSERLVSKKKFIDKDDFENKAKKFVGDIESNIVKLRLIKTSFRKDNSIQPYQHWKIEFQVFFDIVDPYVDSKVYNSGSVYIFPSKKFYEDVNKMSNQKLGAIPEWNDSRTIATVTGKARDY